MTVRPDRRGYRFVNWGRTQRCRAACYFRPADEGEVVELVRRAAEVGVKLKAVGSGHSWSAAACTDDWMVDLARLDRVIEVDRERRRVTVEAGIRLEALNEALARHGLAMRQLGSISKQTVAGAIATGTHGTGRDFGNLATAVVALRLVTGDGRVVYMTEETHGEAFRAARQSLGALGIVTRVTLQCREAFRLMERNFPLPFEEVLARLDELLEKNRHFKFYWLPYYPNVKVFTYNVTDAPISRPGPLRRWFEDHVLFRGFVGLLLRLGAAFPALVPALNRIGARWAFRKERLVERSDEVLNIPMPARHDETEYAVPPERAVEALRALRELVEGRRLPVNFVVEVRWVAADENPLSATWRRPGCFIGAYAYGRRITARYFPAFWELMRRFDGRPHLGKTHDLDLAAMRRAFPALDRFNHWRRHFDPRGLFETPFIRRLLGSVLDEEVPEAERN